MNKHIDAIQNFIKPGKPLLVIGKYGCGKEEATKQAIKNLNLVCNTWYIDILENYNKEYNLKEWCKNIPNDGVLLLCGLEHTPPDFVADILFQMRNPDRCVVLIGSKNSYLNINSIIASKCSEIYDLVWDEQDWLNAVRKLKENDIT